MNSEKILVSDESELGYSYYIDYDDDIAYGDGYYYDSYSGTIYDSWNDGYYSDYYSYPTYDYYYPYYYSDYYYPSYYDYYYDDYYYRNKKYRLTLDGSTVIVGSEYDRDVWLDDDYEKAKVLDARDNHKNLKFGGNDRNNSIISGDGQTTLYGNGGSSNTLIGGNGRNFFFFNGKYDDVAVNFTTGERGNSDVLVFSKVNYSGINRYGNVISFNAPNGNRMQLLTTDTTEEEPILIYWDGANIVKYQIAFDTSNAMTYRDDVETFYFNQPAQIVVTGSDHYVRLDGLLGQNFVNVSTINAAASYGCNSLVGNAGENVIIGGSGVSSLWGNSYLANDTLIGGSGAETFWIGRFAGSDVVVTDDAQDLVCLYDANLSDITNINIDANQIIAAFNTGTQMTVRNSANVSPTFQLADGSRYVYHRDSGQWT